MLPIPLQVIDGFLLKVNVGDALLVGFVLGLLAVIPKGSRRLATLHVITFGALLLLLPGNIMYDPKELSLLRSILEYKIVGLILLVVAPVLFTTADR
ncbi:hypothetical protein BRC64_01290 [Halobacteriales archaeon QH_10_67_22]|jgi:hypothetical protein|nr:MAG: hypothetical protein BRC64_01290 [Halobacteriales archaeon QH_10_67_22]